MEMILKEACDLVVNNYRKLKDSLRYDGDLLNHFGSLVISNKSTDESILKIKNIRTIIKNKTPRMSEFRGDILYMVSILISKEPNVDEYIEEILKVYDDMLQYGFTESPHLVLSAYAIVKHGNVHELDLIMKNMMKIYKVMKVNYKDITNEEDYLECALLALNGIDKEKSILYMEKWFNSVVKLNMFSKNGVQGLTLALLLNHNNPEFNLVSQFLKEFQNKDIKISHQVLALLGIAAGEEEPNAYVKKVKSVIEYLCDQEYEYEFYMDKSFIAFIAIALVEITKDDKKDKFLDELISMVVYSFITSKKQGIVSEILA